MMPPVPEGTTNISDEMTAIVGVEYGGLKSFPIDRADIRKWALAVYYPEKAPRLFWDEEYAKSTPYGGIVAPEDFNPFGWMTPPGQGGDERVEAPPVEEGF